MSHERDSNPRPTHYEQYYLYCSKILIVSVLLNQLNYSISYIFPMMVFHYQLDDAKVLILLDKNEKGEPLM